MKTAPLAAVEPSDGSATEGGGGRGTAARSVVTASPPRRRARCRPDRGASHVAEPGRAQEVGGRRRLPGADLQRQRPARRQDAGAAATSRRTSASPRGRRRAPGPARPGPPPAGAASSPEGMYGRLAASSENGARAPSGAPRSPSTKVTASPSRSALPRATSSAPGEYRPRRRPPLETAWPASARWPRSRCRCPPRAASATSGTPKGPRPLPREAPPHSRGLLAARAPLRSASPYPGGGPARARRRRTPGPRTLSCRPGRRPTRRPGDA